MNTKRHLPPVMPRARYSFKADRELRISDHFVEIGVHLDLSPRSAVRIPRRNVTAWSIQTGDSATMGFFALRLRHAPSRAASIVIECNAEQLAVWGLLMSEGDFREERDMPLRDPEAKTTS